MAHNNTQHKTHRHKTTLKTTYTHSPTPTQKNTKHTHNTTHTHTHNTSTHTHTHTHTTKHTSDIFTKNCLLQELGTCKGSPNVRVCMRRHLGGEIALNMEVVEASWNVMAHAQKPDFVFRRNGRVHLNRRGRQFSRLVASRGVCISGSNAGYTMFQGSVKSTGYPLHSQVSPSLPVLCVTVCHHISTGVYYF